MVEQNTQQFALQIGGRPGTGAEHHVARVRFGRRVQSHAGKTELWIVDHLSCWRCLFGWGFVNNRSGLL
jgi:hypothetical protein